MLKKFGYLVLIVTVILISVTFISHFTSFDLYLLLIAEDSWVENWTAVLLGLSGCIIFYFLIKYGKSYSMLGRVISMLTVLGLLFGSGEEISWGQRLFNIESTEYFKQNNLQREINIHNLEINGIRLNTVLFTYGLIIIFGAYFLLFRFLYDRYRKFHSLIDHMRIPIAHWLPTTLFLILTLAILLIPHDKKWELWECLFAFTILWIIIDPYNDIYRKEIA